MCFGVCLTHTGRTFWLKLYFLRLPRFLTPCSTLRHFCQRDHFFTICAFGKLLSRPGLEGGKFVILREDKVSEEALIECVDPLPSAAEFLSSEMQSEFKLSKQWETPIDV